jgi:hypothetical protein
VFFANIPENQKKPDYLNVIVAATYSSLAMAQTKDSTAMLSHVDAAAAATES